MTDDESNSFGFSASLVVQWFKKKKKNLPASEGDMGSIPESGRSPGGGNGSPLWYSCLGNPMSEEPCGLPSMESQESDTTQ